MSTFELNHLSNADLLRDLSALIRRDRVTTAELLAHIAEVDARKLYAQEGYSSMFVYCVESLHLSEDAAYKRIRAARIARQFPVLFQALAEGRLHLAAVSMLAPHLRTENVDDLIAAATHKGKSEIEHLVARRFGSGETPARSFSIMPIPIRTQLAPGRVEEPLFECPEPPAEAPREPEPGEPASPRAELASERVETKASSEPEEYSLRVRISKSTHDKLRRLQALLSHSFPSGDVAGVLDRGLDLAIAHLEKRKLGATAKPRAGRTARSRRVIPASVRRAVWNRDAGRCTFVGASGHRCGARALLEFDHARPLGRGGIASVENVRLRCREHNALEARRVYGSEFMRSKRVERRRSETCPT